MLARSPRVTAGSWAGAGKQTKRLFIWGLGYTGLGAASYFQERGWSVAGTCRTSEKRQQLQQRGITAFDFDPSGEALQLGGKALDSLRHATHVLSTVPPDSEDDQDPVIMAHSQQLSEHADDFQWVGYISSTSVYGDYEGEWVDEGSELRAAGGKGWSRLLAEHEWLSLHDHFGLKTHIFRCGGIYGPRRSALDAVQRETGSESASQRRRRRQQFTARCHVYDICQTLEASMRHPRPGAAYNIADDDPADRATVMEYAAQLLQQREAGGGLLVRGAPAAVGATALGGTSSTSGRSRSSAAAAAGSSSSSDSDDYSSDEQLPLPLGLVQQQQEEQRRRQRALLSAAGRRPQFANVRGLEEKRVRNRRIKQELGVKLAFPTYREGLAAIAAGDMRPFT